MRVVEINGLKIEVDLRTAKVVEQYKVGDGVKVLVKEYSGYKTHSGVIVRFDMFQNLPTISVAYIEEGYSDSTVKFVGINSETKDTKLAPLQEYERQFDYNKSVLSFERAIDKKQLEIDDISQKKKWFVDSYGKYFSDILNK